MNIKQIMIVATIFLIGTGTVFAQEVSPTVTQTVTTTPSHKEQVKDLKNKLKTEREEVRSQIKTIRSTAKSMRGKAVHINGAVVKTINGSSLTISKDNKDYGVTTSASTKFRRRFWGTGTLADIAVGHTITVWGKWSDDSQTAITATLIRDTSVQKRRGAFIGTIKSKDATSFVLNTRLRGDQTVLFDTNTKFVNRKQVTITSTDVSVGDRVRVKGLWDRLANKVTQVTQVKDYSLPQRVVTGTPSVTITPTPTVTPTPTP